MNFVISVIPGLGFSCAFVLFLLFLGQAWLWKSKGFVRSRDLALFCLFSAFYTLNVPVAHSRLFSDEVTWFFSVGLLPVFSIANIFYFRSLRFYLAIPKWLYRPYLVAQSLLTLFAFAAPLCFYLKGEDIFFQRDDLVSTGNFFIDSFVNRFGRATLYADLSLPLSSFINVVASTILIQRLIGGSKDLFLLGGLLITIVCAIAEFVPVPFTLNYYFPAIFLSNLTEALRMCFLSADEDLRWVGKPLEQTELKEEKSYYQNKALSEERIQKLVEKLKVALETDKLYLNPNLRLEDVSYKIGIPSYQLSQVTRFGLGKNFYDLINSYRIDRVKELLLDPSLKDRSIIEIAYDSGFNSKSTFNTAFKKITGQTPSEFRKN